MKSKSVWLIRAGSPRVLSSRLEVGGQIDVKILWFRRAVWRELDEKTDEASRPLIPWQCFPLSSLLSSRDVVLALRNIEFEATVLHRRWKDSSEGQKDVVEVTRRRLVLTVLFFVVVLKLLGYENVEAYSPFLLSDGLVAGP